MSEYSVKGAELKKMLKHAKNGPVPFGFSPGKTPAESVLCMHKIKPAKAMGTAAKEETGSDKFSYGTAQVFGKTLRLTCIRMGIPQLATRVKRFIKTEKVLLNVEIYDETGLVDSDIEEGLPDDPELLDGDDGDEAPAAAAPPPGPGEINPLDAERNRLTKQVTALSPRVKALPPDMQAQISKHFIQAVSDLKSGKLEEAKKLADQVEAVLDKLAKSATAPGEPAVAGESQASPLVKVAKKDFPPMMIRQKAQVLKQAKGLVDDGKLDEANKLLDALEAQADRSGEAPKADWPEQPSPEELARIRAVQALRDRLVKIAKTTFPTTLERQKALTLQKAKGLVDGGDLDGANKLLDTLEAAAAKTVPPTPMKKRTFLGADFSDPDQMKGVIEKEIEEAFALKSLVAEKVKPEKSKPAKTKPGQVKEKTPDERCDELINGFTNADGDRVNGYTNRNEQAVDYALKKFNELLKKKQQLKLDLRKLWQKEQRKRVEQEIKKNKQSTSAAMQKNFGDDFLEMAKMAEIMAKKLKFDPYNVADGGVTAPMEMGEVAAIYGYSTQDYTKLNQRLRDGDKSGVDAAKFDPYIDACKKGLAKLPAYKGDAIRCDKTAKYFIEDVIANGIRTEKAFMSTGTKQVPGFGEVVTMISNCTSGKEISAFSLHQREGEVLFPPGSAFKFKKFEGEHAGKDVTISNHKGLKGVVDANTTKGVFYFEQI